MRSAIHLLLALLLAVAVPDRLRWRKRPDADDDDDDDDAPPAAEADSRRSQPAKLPQQDLSEQVLYSMLLGEIAAQRGDPAAAAQTYLDLARQTATRAIARRAVELAQFARAPELALDAAKVWHEADPESPFGLRTVTVLARRTQSASTMPAPYVAKLLQGQGSGAAAA